MGRGGGVGFRSVVGVGVLAAAVGCSAAAEPAGEQAAARAGASAVTAHPSHAATATRTAPLRPGERFTTISVARPYAPRPPAGGTDEYRCFLVDPGLREPAYLTGSRFQPANAGIVHHAIVYQVRPADVPLAQALDGRDLGDGWTCFGGTGIAGTDPARALAAGGDWIAAWAPGGTEEGRLPAGTGYRIEPGAQLVLQVHYNMLQAPAGASDRPAIRLRLAPGNARVVPLRTQLLPAPVELPCAAGESGPLCDRTTAVLDVMRRFGPPAGARVAGLRLLCAPGGRARAGTVQSCDHPVRYTGRVYALAGHMHLLGTRVTVQLNPGRPGARTLLDVNPYSFHDQRSVSLPRPVAVRAGDVLRVTCTHDVTQRRHLAELRGLPPRYVVWGDGTADEMCLGIVVHS